MKSMTNEQWQTYEHLIKTILLGLGILLFINTYSKLKLPTMLIVVEVFFIGLMIDQINKYKKYIQTYLLLGAAIGLLIGVLACFHIDVIKCFYESFQWLGQYGGIEDRYVFYKAFCSSIILNIVVLLPLYLLQKSIKLQSGLSAIILIGMIGLTIKKIEVGKEVVVLVLSYMAWVLIQVGSQLNQRQNKQYSKKASTFLVPFALLIGIGSIIGPASPKPISWQFVIKTAQQVAEGISDLATSIQGFTRGDTGEFQIRFSDQDKMELGGKLENSEEVLLTVEVLPLLENTRIKQLYEKLGYQLKQTPMPKNPTYLKGNVRNSYTGRGWDREKVYEVEGEQEYQLEYKELLYSLYRSGINTAQELFHPASIAINFEKLRTKSLFYTNATYDMRLKKDEKLPSTKGVNITYKRTKKKGFNYQFSFVEMNLGSQIFKDYLRSLENFHYQENPIETSLELAALPEDAVFWQAYPQQGIAGFLTSTKLEKQLYERAVHIKEDYTALPSHLPARVYELAQNITKDSPTTYDKLEAIKGYLAQFTYTKIPEAVPKDEDFVDYFLFEQKEGYCTSFATAMAVLSRCMDIPTRYVEGIVVDYNQSVNGVYPVTESKMHAWVEAYIEGYGWVPFDATPQFNNYSAQNWNVTLASTGAEASTPEINMPEQSPAFVPPVIEEQVKEENPVPWIILWIIGLSLVILPTLFLTYIGIVALQYKRKLRKAVMNEKAKLLLKEILFYLGKRGYEKQEEESMLEYAKRIDQELSVKDVLFEEMITIYLNYRYGQHQVTGEEIKGLEAYLVCLKRTLTEELSRLTYIRFKMHFLLVK